MDYYLPGLVAGADAFCKNEGWQLDARWSVRPDWLPQRLAWDGVLVSIVDQQALMDRVKLLGLPTVHLSGWMGTQALPRVDWDEVASVRLALDELQALNLKHLLILPLRNFSVNFRTRRFLEMEARRRGLKVHQFKTWESSRDWVQQVDELAVEIAQLPTPLGCYHPHCSVLFSLQNALAGLGRNVLQDYSFVTLDKDVQKTSELAKPSITGVVPDFWKQGYQGAKALADQFLGIRQTRPILRVPPLGVVHRESTGALHVRDPSVARVVALLLDYPLDQLTIAAMVEKSGISRRSLEQRFQSETGRTLHQYLTARRMEEAKNRLRVPSQKLEAIAFSLGYASLAYFSTAFKREVGCSPKAWRKLQQDAQVLPSGSRR